MRRTFITNRHPFALPGSEHRAERTHDVPAPEARLTQASGERRRCVFQPREEMRLYPSRSFANDQGREQFGLIRSDAGGHTDVRFTLTSREQRHNAQMARRARIRMQLFMPARRHADQAGEKNHAGEERGERYSA